MTLRHCNVCSEWHDLADPWPEACAEHHVKAKRVEIDPEKRSTLYENVSVTRGHWKEDRDTHEMIPIEEWMRKFGGSSGITIIKDIDPYRAVGLPGQPIIGGRKQHKDAMRAHGMVEVGNEKVTKQYEEAPGLRDDIKRALHDVHGDL